VATTDPETVLIRRALPFLLPVGMVAGLIGLPAGTAAAASAVIGVFVVALNFAAHGASLAWASRISLTALYAVGLGGFVVRLGVILAAMFALNMLPWFSPVAFGAAVVPSTIALLIFEMRMLSGSLQFDLWSFGEPT
jgi:hypothetical protein